MDTPLEFSHLQDGEVHMVDVYAKEITRRTATAAATVVMSEATLARIKDGGITKGNVLTTAKLAGIQAAKRTVELIPLCHQVRLTGVEIEFDLEQSPIEVRILATARATDRTGVEMEALTAAVVAALTIYDMCKAVDREIEIREVRLLEKSGGRSGNYVRKAADPRL